MKYDSHDHEPNKGKSAAHKESRQSLTRVITNIIVVINTIIISTIVGTAIVPVSFVLSQHTACLTILTAFTFILLIPHPHPRTTHQPYHQYMQLECKGVKDEEDKVKVRHT